MIKVLSSVRRSGSASRKEHVGVGRSKRGSWVGSDILWWWSDTVCVRRGGRGVQGVRVTRCLLSGK